MSDDRSERLRKRRQQTSEKANPVKRDGRDAPDEPDNSVKPDKPEDLDEQQVDEPEGSDNPVKLDKTDEPGDPDKSVVPVKQRENWGPKQIHLSDDLEDQLDLQLDVTNVELRQAGEEPLEKLMHWYPLIVQKGLDSLEEMDAEDIREAAEQFEEVGADE